MIGVVVPENAPERVTKNGRSGDGLSVRGRRWRRTVLFRFALLRLTMGDGVESELGRGKHAAGGESGAGGGTVQKKNGQDRAGLGRAGRCRRQTGRDWSSKTVPP